MTQELLPCPFCGHLDPEMTDDAESIKWWVRCLCCGARGPREEGEGNAIAAWNIRADLAQVAAQAEVERLRTLLVEERTENLWNAYNTGLTRDGVWTHMLMSDGEWLADECGFDCREANFPDDAIREAIPRAALRVLAVNPPKDQETA